MVISLICLSIKWATEIMPTFLGLAGLAVMADDTDDMGFMIVFIKRVAHRLTVDRQSGVRLAAGLIPSL